MYRSSLLLFLALPLAAQVTVTISPQGTDPIKQVSGYKPKNATLIRLDIRSDAAESSIAAGAVTSAVTLDQKYGIYSSVVVGEVLQALQNKDVFRRAQKAISASRDAVLVAKSLLGVFSATTAAGIILAPEIAAAILPGIGDPRDLVRLERDLLQDNTPIALGRHGTGNDTVTKLVVAMTANANIATVKVQ